MTLDDPDTRKRAAELLQMMNEFMCGLSRYERDCMMSVHLAEMHRQPIDQVAKRVIEDARERFDAAWRAGRREKTG